MTQVIEQGSYVRTQPEGRIYRVQDVKPRKKVAVVFRNEDPISFEDLYLASEDEWKAQYEADERQFRQKMFESAMKDLDRNVGSMVEDLRKMADRIERMQQSWMSEYQEAGGEVYHGPVNHVGNIQHDLMWGMANLGSDRLINYAAALDKAQRDLDSE